MFSCCWYFAPDHVDTYMYITTNINIRTTTTGYFKHTIYSSHNQFHKLSDSHETVFQCRSNSFGIIYMRVQIFHIDDLSWTLPRLERKLTESELLIGSSHLWTRSPGLMTHLRFSKTNATFTPKINLLPTILSDWLQTVGSNG